MKLASLWTDHAVVQRNKPIVVWGWADAKRSVIKATLGSSTAVGATAWDGRFELRLPALPEGGPYELNVKTANGEECTCKDILIGEVWLVSGQSNAEFPLMTFATNDPLDQTEQFLQEGGKDDMLRCITVPDDGLAATGDVFTPDTVWQPSSEYTAPFFTAIGAWFALFLRKKFPRIPVGIIHSSWGGTTVIAWLSRSALAATEAGRKLLAMDDETLFDPKTWGNPGDLTKCASYAGGIPDITLEKVTRRDPGNKGFDLGYARPGFEDADWEQMSIPGTWIGLKLSTHGSVWIRREVDIPAAWAGKSLELHLGGVDKMDTTYFNGVEVGSTGQGFDQIFWNLPRAYTVPGELVKAGRALLAVRAYSFFFDGAFTGPAVGYYLKNPATGEIIPLADIPWKFHAEFAFTPKEMDFGVVSSTNNPNAPHRLFDNKIRPLVPYGIRGALWYQGESDTDNQERTDNYLQRFTAMVREWRTVWGQGDDFPFYFVQLANYRTTQPERWFTIQDMQRRAFLELPNAGVVTGSDLALFEPHDIHPHDKRSFGYRLYLEALSNVYGETGVIPQGPTMDKVCKEGESLRVHFLFGQGLHSKDGGPLKGFEVADPTGAFVPALALIDGDTVRLFAEGLDAVRCRYNANVELPEGNLLNAAELPALSFFS